MKILHENNDTVMKGFLCLVCEKGVGDWNIIRRHQGCGDCFGHYRKFKNGQLSPIYGSINPFSASFVSCNGNKRSQVLTKEAQGNDYFPLEEYDPYTIHFRMSSAQATNKHNQ